MTPRQRLKDITQLFLKLGVIGFGGPAAHIAMLEEEVVTRRGWLNRSRFLDLMGATNLVPGPNSTQMVIHVGYIHGGLFGLILSGVAFLMPAALITGILAWIYVSFGDLPQIEPLFYGIKPAVLAVILGALWKLGKKAVKSYQIFLIGVAVAILLLLGIDEVVALLLGGIGGMLLLRLRDYLAKNRIEGLIAGITMASLLPTATATETTRQPTLWNLGFFFFKVSCILFGSGYVLIAFIERELVNQYGWLTQGELLDAIAIGQFTPGPVLTTSTFIGYLVAGISGAIVSTISIFFLSFVLVGLLNPIIPKLRKSKWSSAFLDAINVSAVALMAIVTLQLAQTLFLEPLDYIAMLIFAVSAIAQFCFQIGALWLVLGGAMLGLIL
ncbi:chromate efflux transporter [Euhalothece natronophila Z-M001]|uniref:Chromate efflux transporter n=1 Tax=Euhalothece natronophila Z-M001 TaxID=522448 RepID=A0A5B8NLL0_9CHRO|nr:chromate efflux transporter [Euhalothece natronophila]QDZ40183.1 chromate efflux transporter [Euhalothece natronophila Z-M001]